MLYKNSAYYRFQLNIHRFKVIARFGLMHVVATNICVWVRTLVLEYLKEITNYYNKKAWNVTAPTEIAPFAGNNESHMSVVTFILINFLLNTF